MKKQVAELEGAELDYWVARADGEKVKIIPLNLSPNDDKETRIFFRVDESGFMYDGRVGVGDDPWNENVYSPSTDGRRGQWIIERELISTYASLVDGGLLHWVACCERMPSRKGYIGPTPLIAAMRAFVSSKFGDTVEIEE